MTRTEHMKWAKARAIECVNNGDISAAFSSIASDLEKHPETQNHIGVQLGMMQLMAGSLNTPQSMLHFIEGFN
jgi:hypothetical protein